MPDSRPACNPRALKTLLAAALVLAAGCGKTAATRMPVYPVKGTILFQGQPIAGAEVRFYPVTPFTDAETGLPRAAVDERGAFHLTTYTTGDGAPAGEYVVTVIWEPTRGRESETIVAAPRGKNRLGDRYGDPANSGIRVTIQQGVNELPPIALQ